MRKLLRFLLLPWRVLWGLIYWACFLLYCCAYQMQRLAKMMGSI